MFLARADASVAAFPSHSEGDAALEAAAGLTTVWCASASA
jgi:hypothetical protein